MDQYPTLKLVLAPHEPTGEHIRELEEWCAVRQFPLTHYSQLNDSGASSRVVLLDSVGKLAELYQDGDIAFVGGGFRGSVHSVMEPAAARCVVTFGPDYHNSNEAELLVEAGGGFVVRNTDDFSEILQKLLSDSAALTKSRRIAREIIENNAGATRKTVSRILNSAGA